MPEQDDLDVPTGTPRDPRFDRSDYRADLSGRVEANYSTVKPSDELVQRALDYRCPHCIPNVFIEEIGRTGEFQFKIAHDDSCPVPDAAEALGA